MKRAGPSWIAATSVLGLSSERRAITRGTVLKSIAPALDRLMAALCVALLMFYVATLPAKAADQIQHAPALMVAHDHIGLGNFSVDAVHNSDDDHANHTDHHGSVPDDEDQPGDHLAGGHHHHGDTGPNLLVPDTASASAFAPVAGLHGIGEDPHIAGLRAIGPERPPRTTSLNA
jgi:hypothetical protein